MRLKFFIVGLLASILVTLVAAPPDVLFTHRSSDSNAIESFNASCVIDRSDDGLGSGTMLDTGYILTAAHVIDSDMDGFLDKKQRTRKVIFKDMVCDATVSYVNTENDFAFLKPEKTLPGAKASRNKHAFGDVVYTIGATGGHPLNISPGLVISPGAGGMQRVSCYVSRGNSGGGIFDSNREVIGIVSMVGIAPRMNLVSIMLPIQGDEGNVRLGWFRGSAEIAFEVNNNCLFIPTGKIRSELAKRSISSLLDASEQQSLEEFISCPQNSILIGMTVNLCIFIWVVIYVRKHLASS